MSKKKVSATDMQKMMSRLKSKSAKAKRPAAKSTTEDLIALKKIKLLQAEKLENPRNPRQLPEVILRQKSI